MDGLLPSRRHRLHGVSHVIIILSKGGEKRGIPVFVIPRYSLACTTFRLDSLNAYWTRLKVRSSFVRFAGLYLSGEVRGVEPPLHATADPPGYS